MRPVGWREDDRASKIIQAQGVKEKPWDLFPSLASIYNKQGTATDNPTASIKTSYFFEMMKNAKGGDALPDGWFEN